VAERGGEAIGGLIPIRIRAPKLFFFEYAVKNEE